MNMKHGAFVLFCLLMPVAGMCMSVEEVGRLAELKTEEALLLEIIHKEGLDHPMNAKDVIYLKERGLSEKVIDYLWKQSFQDKEFLPPQEGESTMIGENLRSYSSTDKSGKKILVLTNLDEDGRRMGPPPAPAPERHLEPEVAYEAQQPREIYAANRNEGPAWASQEEDLQTYQPAPVGLQVYDAGYYPFYSVFSFYPAHHFIPHCKPTWGQQRVNVHGPVQWPGASVKSLRHRMK